MDQKELRELESRCIQEHPPACTATCPVHVDVRGIMAAMGQGDFDAAHRILQKTIPFPGTIGRICDHPCQQTCKRKEAGDALSIGALEKACVQFASVGPAKVMTLPGKTQRVAVVGAGLSGLTAAYDLARKGYGVTIFEASDSPGGRLRQYSEVDLPRTVIQEELSILPRLGVVFQFNTVIGKDKSLAAVRQEYDAVYLGVGTTVLLSDLLPNQDGDNLIDPVTFATKQDCVFAGGTLRAVSGAYSPIGSVADGRRAAISIDRCLQGVSLTAARENEGPFETKLFTGIADVEPLSAVPMKNGRSFYSRHEAMQEATRCLQCQCLECVKVCGYLAYYKGYPKKYIREIYNNESIVKGMHHANKMINSCSLCGLCQEVCPRGLNMGEIIKSARQRMEQRGKMPPSTHDFPLKDMAFNNSERFALTRHQPGTDGSGYVFFPGCQLSASSPGHVEKVYAYLRERLTGGVGLMLRCCGAPAEWSGRQELVRSNLEEIRDQWTALGKPQMIAACSSCHYVFKNHLPEIPLVSLWQVFAEFGLPALPDKKEPGIVSLHDACTTRHEKQIHDNVRMILLQLGYGVEELPLNRELARCCGYGGLMSFANPELAEEVTNTIIEENHHTYVTYCSMCRDRFAAKGKPSLHLLDLIFEEENNQWALRRGPGYSQRRENRVRLKNKFLQEVWGEKVTGERKTMQLIIPEEVRAKLEQRFILLEDIEKVIVFAEETGKKMHNRQTGHYLAYCKPVSVTYWVEYSPQDDSFVIHNAYCHRMEIIEDVKS
ncbi:MAG: pyridine nucleotide-disulfide oxidoreductase/dicluster-binding protein [Bacillota bacterium]